MSAQIRKTPSAKAGGKRAGITDETQGRYSTDAGVRALVWIRAAGHCELCGSDLTVDLRVGTSMRWGEVAHILPASSRGPRAEAAHDDAQAAALTNDPDNLVLACPGCHEKIDRDPDSYSKEDLLGIHHAHLDRIRLAAKTAEDGRAFPLIFLSRHFQTRNDIRNADLLRCMSAEGLTAITEPRRFVLPEPRDTGRDERYWSDVVYEIQSKLAENLRKLTSIYGDEPVVAVAGLADIPALMMLGQALGDRSKRFTFSPNRETGLRWPDVNADPPEFRITPLPDGDGPVALVLALSGELPHRHVEQALPGVRIAQITIDHPSVSMVKNRRVIDAFREALQGPLSQLEAATDEPIHVFAAIPAALAIEFGAFLTMQHRHPYLVYDRDDNRDFQPALRLGHHKDTSP